MAVDDSIPYIVNENQGSINIVVLLDQSSCRPIIIIASPQERSSPSATGNVGIYNVSGSLPLFMCVCMCVRTYVCTYIHTYVRMYVRMYVCMYACMHACMYMQARNFTV